MAAALDTIDLFCADLTDWFAAVPESMLVLEQMLLLTLAGVGGPGRE